MAAALSTPLDCFCACQCNDTLVINGGSGAQQVFEGHGAPAGLLTGQDPTIPAIYTNLDIVPALDYRWSVESQAWF